MNLKHNLSIIFYRAYAIMRAEVSSGSLGMLVWIVEPALYLGAFYLIFSVLGIRGGEDAIPFLLPGLVVWKWFAASVHKGGMSIVGGAAIMQQVYVPKYIFLATVLLSNLYQFLIVFAILLLFLVIYGLVPAVLWWQMVPLVVVQFLLITGVAGVFSVLIPFLRDLKVVLTNGLTLVFFLSGIFFDISKAPEEYQQILYLNPMAVMVESYRAILVDNMSPDWVGIGYVLLSSILLIGVTLVLLRRWDRKFPRVLSV
ncbi:lipopolysaccharide transport system permease protein [Mariprofundus ferrinatatus]|uniref:Transport permease protein n=1 Tax=Mariprofundus ferrinatatus TaxID=1921087 RepID=A0A2K8L2A1_9PROT|nr:ABC transporter permease [Mariprofundus ferrinatatus]ATX81417.1 lipopolysaccharide transport system permease protein [Mariprofundus ferrinatatus]